MKNRILFCPKCETHSEHYSEPESSTFSRVVMRIASFGLLSHGRWWFCCDLCATYNYLYDSAIDQYIWAEEGTGVTVA